MSTKNFGIFFHLLLFQANKIQLNKNFQNLLKVNEENIEMLSTIKTRLTYLFSSLINTFSWYVKGDLFECTSYLKEQIDVFLYLKCFYFPDIS